MMKWLMPAAVFAGIFSVAGWKSALAALPEEPSVNVLREGGKVKIAFRGTLLSAVTNTGPWEVVTNAVSPHPVDATAGQKFYRAGAWSDGSVFAFRSIAALSLVGPLQAHFDLAYAGTPDGMIPPLREKPYFDGAVSFDGRTVPVSIRVRGNSSLQECPFPKLKFKVSKENRVGTPFENAREVKIGTHCAEGGRGTIGRLREQIAAYREVLAYEVMDAAGFVTPRVRRAKIEYVDTTPPTNAGTSVGWTVERQAFLVEDIEVVATRMGARVLSEEELINLERASFDTQLLVDLQLFNALLGNWDYSLPWDTRGVWNLDVLQLQDQTLLPVAGDFDLASWVTGVVKVNAPERYHPELPDLERETLYQLDQIKSRVDPLNFAAGVGRFEQARTAIEATVTSGTVDDTGRTNAVRQIAAFYDAVNLLGL